MKILAFALYALAALSAWTGLGYILWRNWWGLLACVLLTAMCWIGGGLLLEVWA